MVFSGRVYFDFLSPNVWRFYRLLTAAAREGVELRLAWRSFAPDDDEAGRLALASFEAVLDLAPERHGRYLQAILAMHHLDGFAVDDAATWHEAAKAADVPAGVVDRAEAYLQAVDVSTAEARELGVCRTPALYRHGPVLEIALTPAAYHDASVVRRLETIDRVIADDGLWVLRKPDLE